MSTMDKRKKRNELKKNALGERESPPDRQKYTLIFNKSQFILGIVEHNMQYPHAIAMVCLFFLYNPRRRKKKLFRARNKIDR